MIIPFGPWEPDGPVLGQGRLLTAKNVAPGPGGIYVPMSKLVTYGTVTTTAITGAISFLDSSGEWAVFAGTATALYHFDNDGATNLGTRTDVTRTAGGAYSGARWRFTRFGARMIGVGGTGVAPQYYDIGSSTDFANLAGSPPQAKCCAAFGFFVLLGMANGTVKWCSINDSDAWTDGVNQAGSESFAEDGEVQGFAVMDDAAYIIQERAIRRMQYIGGEEIFFFQKIADKGCPVPESIHQNGPVCYFLAHDGLGVLAADGSLAFLGEGRIDKWITESLTYSAINVPSGASSCLDLGRNLYMLGLPATAAGPAIRTLIYNWVENRFSYAAYEGATQGAALGFLFTSYYYNNSNLTGSVGASFGLGSKPQAFTHPTSNDAYLAYFSMNTAHNLEATFETTDFIGGDKTVQFCRGVRPLGDAGTVHCSIAPRLTPSATVTFGSESQNNANDGFSKLRGAGTYMRAKLRIPGATVWSKMEGAELDMIKMGRR